ncbi:NnrS family protein [Rhodobacter capsulatus]|uniref:NnrS family protein n=1 Tax=Rhodobacter capsulatus TaxID=1061 RepID=UPI0003D346D7|nr:NnrS family protein [Rhodobacter capsulatus]ETD91985.1 hypothetical protein U713_00885 [Rhodobacter capsulatus YW2]
MSRIFREGHRTFYLAAILFAIVAMALWGHWIAAGLTGDLLPTRAMPVDWHAHEMIFGYGGAVLAGIFLASAPKALRGIYFPMLAGLWLAGRLAIAFSAFIPAPVVALIDLGFGVLVMAKMAWPVARLKKLETLSYLGIFLLHWVSDLIMHLDWMGVAPGLAPKGAMAGLMACATMNAAFGGKLTAGLTRNAMVHKGETALPRPSGLDTWGPIFTAFCVPAAFLPPRAFGAVLVLAGATNLFRAMGFRNGWAFKHDALLSGFHIGFLCLGTGLYAMGMAGVMAMEIYPGAVHLLAIGAVAGLSSAVMIKMSLGQSGRRSVATAPLKAAGLLLIAATLLRAFGEMQIGLIASAGLFVAGYAAMLAGLWPALSGEKLQPGTPGARPLGHGPKIPVQGEGDQA